MKVTTNARGKVVFVNRYYQPDESATSQLLSGLARALASGGLSVEIVCSRQLYNDPRQRLPAHEVVDGVTVRRAWTSRFGRDNLGGRAVDYMTFYVSSAWTLLRILRRGDVAVAKTDPPLISIVVMLTAKLRGAVLVNWLQDIFPEVASRLGMNPLPRGLDRLVRRVRNHALRGASANIVLGERMREFVMRQGVPAEKIRVIENWALQVAEVPGTQSRLRLQLGLEGKFVVGYSGNLGRAHEFHTLLEAAHLLRDAPDVAFLMVGGGSGMQELKRCVAERGLKSFCFQPYQAQASLSDSLAAADVHWISLLPTLEGLIVPSKLYGLLAVGRPVIFIGDPHGEIAGVLARGRAGICVSVGDATTLAQQILALGSDPPRRADMGARALELYRLQFAAERAIERWQHLLAVTAADAMPPADPSLRAPRRSDA